MGTVAPLTFQAGTDLGTWLTKQTGHIGNTSATQKRKWQRRKIPCMPWKESRIVDERIKFIAEKLRGDHNMTELCQIYNISRKTTAKLSSCDTGSDRETDFGIALQISHLGARKLRARLEETKSGTEWPATSTITAIL